MLFSFPTYFYCANNVAVKLPMWQRDSRTFKGSLGSRPFTSIDLQVIWFIYLVYLWRNKNLWTNTAASYPIPHSNNQVVENVDFKTKQNGLLHICPFFGWLIGTQPKLLVCSRA